MSLSSFKLVLVIAAGLFFFDQLGLWMERKGWLYYRHQKPKSGGGVGDAFQELNALVNPSVRHVMKVKQNESQQRDDQGDGRENVSDSSQRQA